MLWALDLNRWDLLLWTELVQSLELLGHKILLDSLGMCHGWVANACLDYLRLLKLLLLSLLPGLLKLLQALFLETLTSAIDSKLALLKTLL